MATNRGQHHQNKMVHLMVGLLVLMFVSVIVGPSTSAHAVLLSSTPEDGARLDTSPTEIVLTFSEPLASVEEGASLHSSDDDVVFLTPTINGNTVTIPLDDTLNTGAYVLQWRMISADSHPIAGTVNFTVGDAAPGDITLDHLPGWVGISQTTAAFAKYLGLLAAVGVIIVGRIIAKSDISHESRLAWGFALLALIGVVSELTFAAIVQHGSMPESFSGVLNLILSLDTATKRSAVIGLILVGLGIIAADVVSRAAKHPKWWIPGTLFVGAVLTLLLSGHTRTKDPVWLMLTADAIHLTAGSMWLGGIVLLALGLSGKWQGRGFDSASARSSAVSRFSELAGLTALLVTFSGLAMGVTILQTWDALLNTQYGTTLMIKVGLVVLVLFLAAGNRFVFIPRLPKEGSRSLTWLKRLVIGELVLLVAVAGFTARLVHLDPNVQAEQVSETILYDGESSIDDGHTLQMQIKQGDGDEIEISATIIDADGNPVVTEDDLQVDWNNPEKNLGPISYALKYDEVSQEYRGTEQVTITGTWEVTVRAPIDRFTDSRTTIEVTIGD